MPDLEIAPMHAVGELIAAASAADVALTVSILRLMGDERGYALTAMPALSGMDFSVKLGVLQTLVSIHFRQHFSKVPQAKAAIKGISDALHSAFKIRNDIAHAVINDGRAQDELKLQFLKLYRNGTMRQPEYWKTEKFIHYANEFRRCSEALDTLVTALGAPRFEPLFPEDRKHR